ncbi:hypothetical protein V8G54_013307 [Vigna mungo]|uniref:Uncharacterized protein n=1 Tax=Vigna mungo TaxID=3915 RepID=A0AAQ3NVG0_VIGMU
MMHASLKEHNMILFQVLGICGFPGCMHLCFDGLSLLPFTVDIYMVKVSFIRFLADYWCFLIHPPYRGKTWLFLLNKLYSFLFFWTINEMLTFLFWKVKIHFLSFGEVGEE